MGRQNDIYAFGCKSDNGGSIHIITVKTSVLFYRNDTDFLVYFTLNCISNLVTGILSHVLRRSKRVNDGLLDEVFTTCEVITNILSNSNLVFGDGDWELEILT